MSQIRCVHSSLEYVFHLSISERDGLKELSLDVHNAGNDDVALLKSWNSRLTMGLSPMDHMMVIGSLAGSLVGSLNSC